MEQLAEKLHGAQDIWYATNGQIADYLTALRSTRESERIFYRNVWGRCR